MLHTIESVNNVINDFIWGVPAMICIIGVGLYLSIRTGFLQIRKFGYAIQTTIGRMFRKKEASDGALTPFQAVCTALAATVGTGNIAGVAGAIAIGGPGAVFWMWISAILGMCTKFFEVTLAVHFRERNAEGDLVGGPMYYIKNGLGKNWRWLAYLFAAFGVLTVFGTGNATQVNTITTAIDSALLNYHVISTDTVPVMNWMIGIAITILVGLILLGGVKRIGQVTERLVPFMAVLYIVLALGVVVFHFQNIPAVFASIIEEMGTFMGICIILLFLLLIYRGINIAMKQERDYFSVLALTVSMIYMSQALIMFAGVLKLIPLTGITIPFLTYGGSSLLSSFIMLAILQACSEEFN